MITRNVGLRISAVLMLFIAVSASGSQAAAAETTATEQFFVFIYSPGPAWKAGAPMREQPLGPHGRYMKELRDTGKLFAAGPLTDSNGGLVIVRAANRQSAQEMMTHDPAIVAGLFVGRLEPWMVIFDAGQSPKDFLAGK
jgi:uncharacterized protein YciI